MVSVEVILVEKLNADCTQSSQKEVVPILEKQLTKHVICANTQHLFTCAMLTSPMTKLDARPRTVSTAHLWKNIVIGLKLEHLTVQMLISRGLI